jgi:hypothetical protein
MLWQPTRGILQPNRHWRRGQGTAAAAFPSTLTGLVAWYSSDVGVTTSSGNVTQVLDQSGNGNHLTPSGGNVPLNATGYNGHPAFDFKFANNALLKATSIPMGTSSTGYLFFVGQMLTACGSYGGAVGYAVGAQSDYSGANSLIISRNGGANSIIKQGGFIAFSSASISLATNYRIGVHIDAATRANLLINNVFQSDSGITGNFANAGTLVVGGRYVGGAPSPTDNPWEGPIVEIVVGNSALSSTERSDLDTYFTTKWGT